MPTNSGEAELLYKTEGNVMSIYRTFVPESERGKGLAEQLALEAFAIARVKGLKVRPDCAYIKRFVEKHGEMSSLVIGSETPNARPACPTA